MIGQISKTVSPAFTVIERAVIYGRVSGDDTRKDGRNLQSQLEMGRKYAEDKGYRVVAELAEDDRGASGAVIDLPQLNRIREMAQAGQFEVLVVREIDRLSRNLAKQLIVEEELNRAGVRIEYVLGDYDDTPEGRLSKHIRATIAEYEREKIKERMIRGRRNKIKAGNIILHGAPPTYGYRLNDEGEFIVYEPEARIVRLIFEWYCLGDEAGDKLSIRAIANRLTKMEVPTWADTHQTGRVNKIRPHGEWCWTTVSGILRNEMYIGHWHYGKRHSTTELNNRDYWLLIDVPAIVSREIFKLAQEQRAKNKVLARRNNSRNNYLVARRVRCGMCGGACSGCCRKGRSRDYMYYRCNTRNNDVASRECDAPGFRADHVDAAVWNWLKDAISDPKRLRDRLIEYQTEQEKVCAPMRQQLAIIKDLLAQNRQKRNRWLEMYADEIITKDELLEKKASLDNTIAALRKQEVELTAQLRAAEITPELIEDVLEFAAEIREGLDLADTDFEERRWLVEALDVEVELVIEDGQKIAYLRCKLLREDRKRLSIVNTSS